jgi:hypothetical protein
MVRVLKDLWDRIDLVIGILSVLPLVFAAIQTTPTSATILWFVAYACIAASAILIWHKERAAVRTTVSKLDVESLMSDGRRILSFGPTGDANSVMENTIRAVEWSKSAKALVERIFPKFHARFSEEMEHANAPDHAVVRGLEILEELKRLL